MAEIDTDDRDLSTLEGAHRKKKEARLTQRARRDIIKGVMDSAEGRTWLFHLLVECNVFHANPPTDALRMAWLEGQRNVGLRLLSDIVAGSPDLYMKMLEEQNDG